MDREELDKRLEQNGRKIQLNKDDKSSEERNCLPWRQLY